jgi:hypothetical protein
MSGGACTATSSVAMGGVATRGVIKNSTEQ